MATSPSELRKTKAFYDDVYKRYRREDATPFEPALELAKIVPKHSRVLDIGGGVAIPVSLAHEGLDVTVYEISRVAVDRLNFIAKDENLRLRAELHDVRDGITGNYRIVVATAVLQHLSPDEAATLLASLADHVTLGGLAIIVAHHAEGIVAARAALSGADAFFPTGASHIRDLMGPGWKSEIAEPFSMNMRNLDEGSTLGLLMRMRRVMPPAPPAPTPKRGWFGHKRG